MITVSPPCPSSWDDCVARVGGEQDDNFESFLPFGDCGGDLLSTVDTLSFFGDWREDLSARTFEPPPRDLLGDWGKVRSPFDAVNANEDDDSFDFSEPTASEEPIEKSLEKLDRLWDLYINEPPDSTDDGDADMLGAGVDADDMMNSEVLRPGSPEEVSNRGSMDGCRGGKCACVVPGHSR
ncbi:uncharacterized protein DNG_05134 [Cephalotrichum gorgonifer]|uniref:Uncharacterized protein n=1 Tax=Cephalotrichum gorgonifer TaxID=2041049 RepID=A0AAE8SV93_9PEZI|nr:uncharacterized protein DNG_05134 [Cephalotrichum gorgonifer]